MAQILQYIKDYGPAAATLFSLIALVVVFVVNSKVSNSLKKIIRLKDDTRNEKSKVIVEAFRVISKLQKTPFSDYKELATELEEVYGRMYSTIADPKLIQAYNRVITIFILGNTPSLIEFQALARKELGLPIVYSKDKQNYLLMMNNEEERIRAKQELEEQKLKEELELQRQKEYLKEQKQKEKELKQKEKEQLKLQKQQKNKPSAVEQKVENETVAPKEQVETVDLTVKKENKVEE